MKLDVLCDAVFGEDRVNGGIIKWTSTKDVIGETKSEEKSSMDLDVMCDSVFGEDRVNGGVIKWTSTKDVF